MSPDERAEWEARLEARVQKLRELEARGRAELAERRAREASREQPA